VALAVEAGVIRRLVVVAALMATIAVACDAEETPSGGLVSLAGTSWAVASVGGASPVPGSVPTISFDATTITGNGGCNHIGGRYHLDPTGHFAVTDFGGTAMACARNEINDFETAFMQAVGTANQAAVSEGQLILRGTGPEVVLVRAAPSGG
jgi:heat shock protein HslJ